MNIFAFSGILLGFTSTILVLFLVVYGRSKIHKVWALFNIVCGIWGCGSFFIGTVKDHNLAIVVWKISLIGVIFVPVFFYHLACLFCEIESKRKKIIIFAYLQGSLFLLCDIFTNYYISDVKFLWNTSYYMTSKGIVFPASFIIWLSLVILGHYEIINNFKNFQSKRKNQALYLFLGLFLGFLGGTTNFFPIFGIEIYPYGNFTVTAYEVIVTYAILKFRLLDINILLTRTGIFVAVYSLVLGMPFALAFGLRQKLFELFDQNWWMVPLISSTVLATAGPFIYIYIQKKAEDRLFQEQRRYQTTLRQASYGMGRIKDLRRLLDLIVHIVNRTIGLKHTVVYLNDTISKKFIAGAKRSKDLRFKPVETIEYSSSMVQHLLDFKRPIVYEEVKQLTQDYGDRKLAQLETELKSLNAEVVVPSLIDEKLLAIIVLGKRLSGKLYNDDDLAVFTILANQAALALENAQFYEDIKRTHEQLFRAEKMATIGTMADGLSHQINNRFHALGFIAGDALDSIKMKKDLITTLELKDLMVDIEHALSRIQENVSQGGEIVRGLLKYTRKGEEGLRPVDLDQLLNASVEMTQFKIKPGELTILREYDPNSLAKIKGNFTQLQEVFFNMIDNAYDAMVQRKHDLKEPGYKPTLKISASSHNGYIDITLQDNGIGIKEEDKEKLFTPFFTTKVSSQLGKKGTGLGLYVIQKLIEDYHGGKVRYDSEYKKGTRAVVHLPAAGN